MKPFLLALAAILGALSSPVLAADFLSAENPALVGTARSVYVDGQAFFGSDVVPLVQANKDWSQDYSPRAGENYALISTRVETGVQWNGFRLGYIERNDWIASANRDTLDIYRASKQNLDYDNGRNYLLDYHLRGFAADGLRLTKSFSHELESDWTVAWGVAASVLHGRKVRSEDISGSATGTGGRNYTTTVDWTRDYSGTDTIAEGFPPAFQSGSPSGEGYAADFGMTFDRKDGLHVEWIASDLIGRMNWHDIQERTLSGSNLPGAALPGGRKWRVDLVRNIPTKQALSVSIPTRMAKIELGDTRIQGLNLPRVGLAKRLGENWTAHLDYDFHFSTVGLGVSYRWLYFNVRSDSLNANKARAFGLGFGARLAF